MSLLSEARKRMGDSARSLQRDDVIDRPHMSVGEPQVDSCKVGGRREQDSNRIKNRLRPLFKDLDPEKYPLEELRQVIYQRLSSERLNISDEQLASLVRDFLAELTGYGPIQSLMQDDDVTEIMINGAKSVYYERQGQIFKSAVEFENEDHLFSVVQNILKRHGKDVNQFGALIEASLDDGSRMNVVMPPVSVNGITLTIRRFGTRRLSMRDLLANNTLSQEAAEFLRICVIGRMNMIISGGSGTGKSTLLNCLSEFIPETERLFTIEDVAELRLKQPHVVSLVTQSFPEPLTMRALLIKSLRMRPDRIIVGECRGDETVDMLQAMNSGHDGSITTLHASGPRDALQRLENMVLMSGLKITIDALRQQIVNTIDLVIHLTRDRNGRRYVESISEVQRLEGSIYVMQEVFKTQQLGGVKKLLHTGVHPISYEKIAAKGVIIPKYR